MERKVKITCMEEFEEVVAKLFAMFEAATEDVRTIATCLADIDSRLRNIEAQVTSPVISTVTSPTIMPPVTAKPWSGGSSTGSSISISDMDRIKYDIKKVESDIFKDWVEKTTKEDDGDDLPPKDVVKSLEDFLNDTKEGKCY